MPRRHWLILLFVLLALTSITSRVEAAADTRRGDKCVVAEDEVITEDFYFICRIVDIRGTVEGDVIGAAAEVTIHRTAHITGDLWVGGGKLVVEGTVGDDLHFGGLTMHVTEWARFTHPRVDLTSVALNTEIHKDATLPGDLLIYGYQAAIVGSVAGDVDFVGETLVIDGVIGGSIDVTVGDPRRSTNIPTLPVYDISFQDPGLWIGPDAYISGNVIYDSNSPSDLPDGVIQGWVAYHQTGTQPDITKVSRANEAASIIVNYIRQALEDTLTLLVLGAIGLRFAPLFIQQPAVEVRERSVPTIGWGLITFMLSIPVVIGVLLLGLLLVLILYVLALNELTLLLGIGVLIITAVLVGLFSFLLFFMGRVIASFMLGKLIERFVDPYVQHLTEYQRLVLTMGIGALIYTLITNVPLPAVGLIVELITTLAGAGAVMMVLRTRFDPFALFPTRTMLTPVIIDTDTLTLEFPLQPALPPPEPEPPQPAPGMENLPEGFNGFDEDW